MKYFWLAVALVLTAGAGIAAAQTDTRMADTKVADTGVAMAGLYSPIPSSSIFSPSPGITKVHACSGRETPSCALVRSQSDCTGAFQKPTEASNGQPYTFMCVWRGSSCNTGSGC